MIFCHGTALALCWQEIHCIMSIPHRYNQKSDMWALGCVLYEMLTLRKVFDATVSKLFFYTVVHMVSNPRQEGVGYSTKSTMGQLHPEVQPHTLLYTPFSRTTLYRPLMGASTPQVSNLLCFKATLSNHTSTVRAVFIWASKSNWFCDYYATWLA